MTNKKVLYIVIFMHTMFFIFAFLFLNMQKEKNINKYLNQLYYSSKITFNKEISLLNKNMDLLEQVIINNKILNIIDNAYTDFNKSRKILIKVFMPKYRILKRNGFYLVHFHLLNGRSLVRFHNLKEYNDYLYSFRPSIKYVQTYGKIYHGFEIGKGIGGFRSVYPLFYKGKIIGSFEISVSINRLINYMFVNEHFAIIVKRDIIDNNVFQNQKKQFKKCIINPDYYIWGNACKLFKHREFVDFDKKINIIENNVVFSYPLYDVNGFKEGFIVNVIPLKKLKVIKEIKTNYDNMVFIVMVLYIVILLGILFIYFYFKIKALSEIDYLTKILNRKGCMKNIKRIKDYSVLVVDIDFFKKINDTYGHDKGDMVLKGISNIFKKNLRNSDVVCRWGGEEFVIILPETDLQKAVNVAEKIRNIIQKTDFDSIKVTVSIGVAKFNGSFEDTFKIADDNLYKAKNSGRNRVVG